MKTIACVAAREFTAFVDGYGLVVGAPESSLEEAKKPKVPEHVVDRFIAEGFIKAPKGWAKAKEADAPAADAAEAEAAAAAPTDDQAPA